MNGTTREEEIALAQEMIRLRENQIKVSSDALDIIKEKLQRLEKENEPPHFGRPGDFGPVGIYLKTDFFLHSDGDMRPNTMDARCTPCTGNLFDLMDETKGGGSYVLGLTRADITLLHYLLSIASLKSVQNIEDRDSVISKIKDCLHRTDAALGIKKG